MLLENRNLLRVKSRVLLEQLDKKNESSNVEILPAKNKQLTMKFKVDDYDNYIHSKYDPSKEVEILIKKNLELIESEDFVIFIGFGLGYHVKAFIERFSISKFSLIEFNEEILKNVLNYVSLTGDTFDNLNNIYCLDSDTQFDDAIEKELTSNKIPKIIILPTYERLFKEEVNLFSNKLKAVLLQRKLTYATNKGFQKRWTTNSLLNSNYVLNTPNFLMDTNKNHFENKPAILVAAGPSLNSEFDNLRKIKENKSAYIFSVGSSINSLIEHDIYPDAAFSYDPLEHNQKVFEKIKKENITKIPLIFGSSVGYETLLNYNGKLLHFITNQDYLSNSTLKHNKSNILKIVNDAPSISIITLKQLIMQEFNPIVLVGQNFSYKDNYRYADGINYEVINSKLDEKDISSALEVESVNGQKVLTNEGFLNMKKNMEIELGRAPAHINIINTTIDGAKIEHTTFESLTSLKETFSNEAVVENWYKVDYNEYDQTYTSNKWRDLKKSLEIVKLNIKKSERLLKEIRDVRYEKLHKVDSMFTTLDQYLIKITNSLFYKSFLSSMNRFEFEIINKDINQIKFEKDIAKKSKIVSDRLLLLIDQWKISIEDIEEEFLNRYKFIIESCEEK